MQTTTIEVIAGPMLGGKTTELGRRLERCQFARKRYLVIRPVQDTRTERSLAATMIADEGEFFRILEEHRPQVLAIDEAQFFEPWIVQALMTIRDKRDAPRLRIIIAGLDMDYRRLPFGSMPQLMAIADAGVTKLTGVCMKCGENAAYTQILEGTAATIQIGGVEMYEVRCLDCHYIP